MNAAAGLKFLHLLSDSMNLAGVDGETQQAVREKASSVFGTLSSSDPKMPAVQTALDQMTELIAGSSNPASVSGVVERVVDQSDLNGDLKQIVYRRLKSI